jgi:hypothetical protein
MAHAFGQSIANQGVLLISHHRVTTEQIIEWLYDKRSGTLKIVYADPRAGVAGVVGAATG